MNHKHLIVFALLFTIGILKEARGGVVATIGDNETIYNSELIDDKAVFEFNKQALTFYQARHNKLDKILLERLIKKEAGSGSTEDYFKRNVLSKTRSYSEKDVADFMKKNVRQVPSNPIKLKELKQRIKNYLTSQNSEVIEHELLYRLIKKYKVKVSLAPELMALPSGNASKRGAPQTGKSDAKVTIVEFSDFQCPFCSKAVEPLRKIKRYYSKKDVTIQFRQFPLNFHPRAEPTAIASLCAHEQGKFWGFHDLAFKNQKNLSEKDLRNYARKLNLRLKKFNKCLKNPSIKEKVQEDYKAGTAIGVQSTPTFIINGKPVAGALSFEVFKSIIEAELADK